MKHAILISALVFLFNKSFACSCFSFVSFCWCHDSYDLAASGVVVGTFPHGISIKVLHIFNGSEDSDTIKVWDLGGPYSSCNDSSTDASAAYLGTVGDTLIIALPRIDTIKNAWDVIGDYITPGFNCDEYKLRVVNNTVTGFISGSTYCHYMNNCLESYNYDAFIADFPAKRLSCETWLYSDEPSSQELLNYYPNPASDKIIFATPERGTLTITNHTGQFVDAFSITGNQTQIPTDHLLPGIYFMTFQTDRNSVMRKLVVQR